MSLTPSTSTAYSMVAASPVGLRGGVRGDDVARGAQLEELTGPGTGDQGRDDPGVGAGDEQDLGGLAFGELGELLRALTEGAGVVDEGLHVVTPPGARRWRVGRT